ncbi:hypothetical protein GCM10009690_24230 [Brevibacterium permense]|uniref:Uncharacterized protein n=1 Tax=Brevibacterium permense TaxID=234834 RepID=A0ABN2AIR9_9MICO
MVAIAVRRCRRLCHGVTLIGFPRQSFAVTPDEGPDSSNSHRPKEDHRDCLA